MIFFLKRQKMNKYLFFFFFYPHDLNIQSQFLSKNDKNWKTGKESDCKLIL